MEILIIEDNEVKFKRTEDYLSSIDTNVTITNATCVRDAKQLIKANHYDGIVIDMQLPNTSNGSIDRKGGISILMYLDYLDIKSPRCVNTSAEDTKDTLTENNYGEEQCIINSTMCNCTNSFTKFLDRVKECKIELSNKYANVFNTDVSTTMLESLVIESEQLK